MGPNMLTLFVLAIALSMDAFAAAISQGAAARPKPGAASALRVGVAFGSAQALMPLGGWALGVAFAPVVQQLDHWVAFILLAAIGGHMVWEGLRQNAEGSKTSPLAVGWALFAAAIATSIDAAAAGVTLAFMDQPVLIASLIIGAVTLVIATAGVFVGGLVGAAAGRRAEVAGGLLLIFLGMKILTEHLLSPA